MRATYVLLSSLVLVSCSSTVPPTVTQPLQFLLREQPRIMLDARSQVQRVIEALDAAGILIVDDPSDATYRLGVKIGGSRASKSCGTKNNVAYLLFDQTRRIMVIKARGWTGSCTPNVFDEMSELLASQFAVRRSGD